MIESRPAFDRSELVQRLQDKRGILSREIERLEQKRNSLREAISSLPVEEAVQREKRRLARDLHDGVTQELTLLLFQIESWRLELRPEDEAMHARLSGLVQQTRGCLEDLRQTVANLRGTQGLDTVSPLIRRIIDHHVMTTRQNVQLLSTGTPFPLPFEIRESVGAIVGEALVNMSRHAPGAEGEVLVDFGEQGLRVSINDNGPGFRDDVNVKSLESLGRFGLLGMAERAAEAHARITFGRAAQGGAQVMFCWENGEMS